MKRMNLVAYMKTGPTALHSGGWRHPEATLDDIFDPRRYEQAAQLFESAKLDGVFFADLFGFADTYKGLETFLESGGQNSYLDPMAVLPLMARVTQNLGIGATISTSFHSAFQIARSLASVDMLSGGRVAWNVVTSTNNLEAANAGMDELPPHDERYDRADEVMEACFALWDGWDSDAFVLDKKAGRFADGSKVRYANYEGKWTKTRGPLPTPRSPQGHPVIMQAGSSDRGREFGARWGELIFTPQFDAAALKAFCTDMRSRVTDAGRDPSSLKVLRGITPIIGETESIAFERADYLESLEHAEYNMAYASLSVGADLSKHKTAEEVERVRGVQGTHGGTDLISKAAAAGKTDFAQAASNGSGRKSLVGTAESVADQMQDLFETSTCDGFVIMPATFPTSHEQFCRSVVPELQRRGLFRTKYTADTLRGNLLSS